MEVRVITIETLANEIDDFKFRRSIKEFTGVIAFVSILLSLIIVGTGLYNSQLVAVLGGIVYSLISNAFWYGWWHRKHRFYLPFLFVNIIVNLVSVLSICSAVLSFICYSGGADVLIAVSDPHTFGILLILTFGHLAVNVTVLFDRANIVKMDTTTEQNREKLIKYLT